MLDALVELGLTDDWQNMIGSIIVRGHFQIAGSKGDLYGGLFEAAATSRAILTPAVTVRDAIPASF